MKTLVIASASIATLILGGCASELVVKDGNGTLLPGVPVHAPALMKVVKKTTFMAAPGKNAAYCTTETSEEIRFLPLGRLYHITFNPAQFGDGEFGLAFAESGSLQSVTLNSKASTGVSEITGLLSTVLSVGKTAATGAASQAKGAPDAAQALAAAKSAADTKAENCLVQNTQIVELTPMTAD